jgi:hypothetical protein
MLQVELALDDYSHFHERDRTEAELITHLEELCSPEARAWQSYGVVHIQGTPVVSEAKLICYALSAHHHSWPQAKHLPYASVLACLLSQRLMSLAAHQFTGPGLDGYEPSKMDFSQSDKVGSTCVCCLPPPNRRSRMPRHAAPLLMFLSGGRSLRAAALKLSAKWAKRSSLDGTRTAGDSPWRPAM